MKSAAGAVFLVASLTLGANAADFYWNVPGPAQWDVDGNWNLSGVPGSGDRVRISNAGTAFIDSDVGSIQRFELAQDWGTSGDLEVRNGGTLTMTANATAYVGARGPAVLTIEPGAALTQTSGNFYVGWENTSSGTVIQNGGTVDVAGNIDLAQMHSGSFGRYEIHGGTLDVGTYIHLGRVGTGEFVQHNGTVTVNANVDLAQAAASSSGRYEIHGGTLDVGTYLQIGRQGTGEFIQTGGVVYARRSGDALMVGAQGSSTGLYEMDGGELDVPNGPAYVGQQQSSRGTFRQYDGTVALGRELYIGNQRNTQGLWEIHDGTLDVDRNLSVGREGTGDLLQLGGAVSVGSSLELAQSHADSSGRYEMQNGSLDIGTYIHLGRLGTGELVQHNGAVTVNANVDLAQASANSFGRYEIHGGTLDVGTYLQIGRLGTGEFLQTGGEVYVRRQDSDPALMVGAQGSATGLYTMEGGELHVTRGRTVIGSQGQSNGTFLQHDGTVSLGHHLTIGNEADTEGLWEIRDGELNLSTNKDHFFYLGNAGEGRFVQTGGNVTQPARGAMYLANSGSGEGYYDISGGTLDQGSLSIGSGGGFGEFTQTGGDVYARRDIRIARAGGTGAYAISGGTLTVDNSSGDNDGVLNVGYDTSGSTGTFTQTGGSVRAFGVRLGNASGTSGSFAMIAGDLTMTGGDRDVMIGQSGTGQFTQSGGVVSGVRNTRMGNNGGSEGTLVLENDAQWTTNYLYVGNQGTGRLEIHDSAQMTVTTGGTEFVVGNSSGSDGTIVQTGGTMRQNITGANYLANSSGAVGRYEMSGGTLEQGSLSIGSGGGFGEFTQTGGDVYARRDIRIARHGGTGDYAISGGTLTVDNTSGRDDGRIVVGHDGSGATGTFTQSGGLVDAMGLRLADASGTSGTYGMSGGELRVPEIARGSGTAEFLWSGGTIRPRNGGNLSVTTPLTLSGTDATFNSSDAGGTARNIAVDSPMGGDGSLTKTGAGTLVLSAANTYSGQTTIEAGTVHVTGSLSNNGSTHIRIASAGDAFGGDDPTMVRRIAGGDTFAGLGSQIVGAGTLDTTADLLAGMNESGGPLDLGMAWRTASTADTATFPPLTNLLSDVLQLDGMDGGNGQTDPFVLEMSYDASLVQPYHDPLFLAWLDEGEWVKAVNGNFGWGGSAEAEFAGSWDAFVTANGLDPANDLPDYLGSWGVDTTASTAWAVLNHNSQFAVLAIPEPGTWLLLLCAAVCGLLMRRRSR